MWRLRAVVCVVLCVCVCVRQVGEGSALCYVKMNDTKQTQYLVRFVGGSKSSLGDAKSSLGDTLRARWVTCRWHTVATLVHTPRRCSSC